ncbi:MAG: SDR family oxidoreductase [Actinomycetota bacterium]|nr:SDR family oxidoreductase [Nocardioidaceae bacterium]MDQ3481489.1 SDR family oxidoreductase [Actinomycetota bacterium]
MVRSEPRRVVITGGAGFVGSWLCEVLSVRGAAVVCVDDFSTGMTANVAHLLDRQGFEFVEADVSAGLVIEGPVDWVMHFASPASPPHYLRLPVETMKVGSLGTMHALELARDKGARFVMASTSEVYGDPLEHPQRETYWGNVNPVGPRSVYDEAKRFSEALTTAYRTAYGLDTAIVRIFNTYGPRMRPDDGRAIPTFISQAMHDEPITVAGDGSQTRSICYVDDTVAGVLALAASCESGPVNIGNGDEMSMLELAERIKRLVGSSAPITFVDLPTDDPRVRCPDISLAHQLLGWQPHVDAEVGLTNTIEWFASQREVPLPS